MVLGKQFARGGTHGLLTLLAYCALACASSATPVPARRPMVSAAPVHFSFVDPSGTPVSSESTQGRVTLVALVTTYDWASQFVLRRVNQALGSYVPRINAFAVILEPPSYAVLAPAFSNSLGLHFPVVMADHASLGGGGVFGPIDYVPTVLVLDQEGRIVERLTGLVSPEQIHAALERAPRTSSDGEIPER